MAGNILTDKFLKSVTVSAGNVNATIPSINDRIPDNCHTVIIYNPDATNDVYVAIGANGDVLDPTGAGGTVPTIVPKGTSFTMNMGTVTLRPNSSHTASDQLVYQSSAGSIQVNINYISTNVC